MDPKQFTLYHGGHRGTEAFFGECAERWGVREVTLSFEGHQRERSVGVEELSEEQLEAGDVSMEIVFRRLGRRFATGTGIRRVIRTIFHVVTRGHQLFAVGWIQEDGTVRGGTGWGVELAKFFNRDVFVYDQDTESWCGWTYEGWEDVRPKITERSFSATGTRNLSDSGRQAIETLFERSFGPATG